MSRKKTPFGRHLEDETGDSQNRHSYSNCLTTYFWKSCWFEHSDKNVTVSRILKREKYLHLSKGSYLFSKLGIMFFISLVQSLTFVLVGNSILEVKGMLLPFWMVLFSTSCFANVLGLNISATFNSAKVIYIIIPILIIPQLLFSGVIVRFDRLFPAISSQNSVPLIGNVMTSRWAYEAMAVHQFRNNEFNKIFFVTEETR